jgi:hypothetical protein
MTDEELIEQSSSVPTMYFDGFGAYRKLNGVLRCVGYVFGGAQLNLIVSLAGADVASTETRRILEEKTPTKGIVNWDGNALAHTL